MSMRPRPPALRPTESYPSFASASIIVNDQHEQQGPPGPSPCTSSQHGGPDHRPHQGQHAPLADEHRRDDLSSKRFGLVARPRLHTTESALSVVSATSSTSDLVLSATDPMPSPFFVSPPVQQRTADKDHHPRSVSPFPRPDSPLPALPPPSSSSVPAQHVRAPQQQQQPPTTKTGYPAPPTSLNSLAAFKAAQASSDSQGGCSSSTHRTSSDVDLDSLQHQRDSRGSSVLRDVDEADEEARGLHREREGQADWVGIEVRPAAHDIPESHLVRSSSGQLVGARHARAASAVDLRAQFKRQQGGAAGAGAGQGVADDVAITIDALGSAEEYADDEDEDGDDAARRHAIRLGKRPLEGARAQQQGQQGHGSLTAPLEQHHRFLDPRRDSDDGFTYGAAGARFLLEPPRSAPPVSQATFADRQEEGLRLQQQKAAPPPQQQRAFPLPLRLLQQTKRSAEALISPALSAATAFARSGERTAGVRGTGAGPGTVADSDVDSLGASPLFDSDVDASGTVRTAPSTPNDTPVFQDCFDEDETTPPLPVPVPHRLGASAGPLAGLGFDFGAGTETHDDEFPLVPLRQSRRVSLPPVGGGAARRRASIRHDKIPSLAISPPPPPLEERPSEDGASSLGGASSSTLSSQDSAVDPTASPSRRLSKRLSLVLPATTTATTAARPASRPSVHFDQPSAAFHPLHKLDTPSSAASSNGAGPSVPTPTHLLVTPTPPGGMKRDPSFSFSPAPLRLVKVQLLRAAGYTTTPTTTAPDEPPVPGGAAGDARHASSTASPDAQVIAHDTTLNVAADVGPATSRRRAPWWDDWGELLAAPTAWADEVVPAKLTFLVRDPPSSSSSASSTDVGIAPRQAGFLLLAPWLWLLGGWYLRPTDGEFPRQRGQRCREPQCGCGRIMRGSGVGAATRKGVTDRYAGLDRWVFMNRVAAAGGGAGVAALFAAAVWSAATA